MEVEVYQSSEQRSIAIDDIKFDALNAERFAVPGDEHRPLNNLLHRNIEIH